ncbi:MAG: hypothetical protein ABSA85_16300, partial [Terracidiphilus sp.]
MAGGSQRTRFFTLVAFFWEAVFFGEAAAFFLALFAFFGEALFFPSFRQRRFALSLIFIRASSDRVNGFEGAALRSILFCCWTLLLHS